MMNKVYSKQDDTAVIFTDTLMKDGAPLNLTGAAVYFLMANDNKSVRAAATIVSAVAGTVRYTVSATDLDTAGTFDQEWEVTLSSGKILTVPSNGHNKVRVIEDLG